MVRRAVLALVQAGEVDFEQTRATQKTYFLTGCGPRHGAILVPAAAAPRIDAAPSHWASTLLDFSERPGLIVTSMPCAGASFRRIRGSEVRSER